MSVLTAPQFHDEEAAYRFVEAHVWPEGRICPHCGTVANSGKLAGKSTRVGVYKCYDCRKPFTVKIGTIFESSHVKLHLWLQAIFLMCASKKGISSNQLHRTLGVTLKTAWFMSHRIREAMSAPKSKAIGGGGNPVEVDETFIGPKKGRKKAFAGHAHLRTIFALVERGGELRSFHIDRANAKNVRDVMVRQISPSSAVMTDEAAYYKWVGREFGDHQTVNHRQDEYVRGIAHTNTLEGFFSIFKRGMRGVYQHCAEKHLHRYLSEFDFRYNNRAANGIDDEQRANKALRGIKGKRLTYRTTRERVKALHV